MQNLECDIHFENLVKVEMEFSVFIISSVKIEEILGECDENQEHCCGLSFT